jgi:hypothetical protein
MRDAGAYSTKEKVAAEQRSETTATKLGIVLMRFVPYSKGYGR